MRITQITASPCSNPELGLDEVLSAYAKIGFRHFEVFTGWVASAFDYRADPEYYLVKGRVHGIDFTSMHLPPIVGAKMEETLFEALAAARFAHSIGAKVVLYKASDRETYIKAAPAFLDGIRDLHITPVIQNHYGTPLTTLDDVKEVFEGIADPRMHALLEVGHFHSAGVGWREAAEYLGKAIACVHIKDQIGRQSVPFGTGEIYLYALFAYLDERGYTGQYVVEMEVADRENTLAYLAEAYDWIKKYCEESK